MGPNLGVSSTSKAYFLSPTEASWHVSTMAFAASSFAQRMMPFPSSTENSTMEKAASLSWTSRLSVSKSPAM